jgi:alginate O-acetyltransferase complex protein AlgI
MNEFLPRDASLAVHIAGTWVLILLAGLGITRLRSVSAARGCAWTLVLLAAAGIDQLCADEPAGLRMLALIVGTLFAMKAVVSVEAQAAGGPRLPPLRWLGFAALWVGMRPAPFAMRGSPLSEAGRLVREGALRLSAGVGVVILARLFWLHHPATWREDEAVYLAMLLALPGLSLILHFGLLDIHAGLWRFAGVDCRPLFRSPLYSRSLSEFWGRRWNLAFSEMTAVAVYRPLVGRFGREGATAVAFVFSGLLHELAISVPVRAGYGLPMLYFVLHGTLVLMEQRWQQLGRPIERHGFLAHVWTIGWLALPLPILFHPYFLRGIVAPLLGITPPTASMGI